MGKKVIPEQVEYFCDVCNAKLEKNNHNDFTMATVEGLRDFNGSLVNDHREHYELCKSCKKSFKDWLKGLQA